MYLTKFISRLFNSKLIINSNESVLTDYFYQLIKGDKYKSVGDIVIDEDGIITATLANAFDQKFLNKVKISKINIFDLFKEVDDFFQDGYVFRKMPTNEISGILKTLYTNSLSFEFAKDAVTMYQNIKSCMQGKTYVRFYDELNLLFPDIVKFLTLIENGTVIGRALVWNLKYFVSCDTNRPVRLQYKLKEQYFVDRIYPSDNASIVASFKEYAKQNNAICKLEQSMNSNYHFQRVGGESFSIKMKLPLNISGLVAKKEVPYVDTFSLIDDCGFLTNDVKRDKRFSLLQNTSGRIDSENYRSKFLKCIAGNKDFTIDCYGKIILAVKESKTICPVCGKKHDNSRNYDMHVGQYFDKDVDLNFFKGLLTTEQLREYLKKRNLLNFDAEDISVCHACRKDLIHECPICGNLTVGELECDTCKNNNLKKCKICGNPTNNENYCDDCMSFIKKMDNESFFEIMKDQ